ncbi:peptidoglycan-binding protein [Luteimonas sp. 3794]|uniref:peptidoglycan-binding protein n=1 Tax=Luteimonas sp. 3794 TaxID=2817730 RepID=UPI002863B315|nr:peptidoglycan-binding protein [Luteimonas sp. 3794]MDR6989989.1 putative chitinase [Luteimonas sp. 3794]
MTTEREAQLLHDAYAAGITQPRELANFMAQVGHESGGLERLEESFRYTRSAEQISSNVRSALREGRDALEAARLEALAGRPEQLAELMYGGRMGNAEPGDGYLYRGRGYMQLTGKNQYAAAGEALDLDLVGNPDLAAQPEHASRIATWYWQQNVPRDAREDARGAGAAINGADPPNGLADREQRFARWDREITPERIQAAAVAQGVGMEISGAASTSFDQTIRLMLPPQAGIAPHVTGHYGEHRGERAHGGTDFNYVGGQNGLNLAHPAVHSPVAGVVTMSGGAFGTVKIRDAQGHSHEILHLEDRLVVAGQTIAAGDPIGTMGGRGPDGPEQYARHVHYQLRDPQGALLSPEAFWDRAPVAMREEAVPADPLREGSRGRNVHDLQVALAGLGLTDAREIPLQPDGVFGARTAEAVRAFQQAQGLDVDGIVGPATRGALERLAPHQSAAAPGAPQNASPFASPLDALLAAAKSGDPDTLKDALHDFSQTSFGREFKSAQTERVNEPAQSAQEAAPEQGCR